MSIVLIEKKGWGGILPPLVSRAGWEGKRIGIDVVS